MYRGAFGVMPDRTGARYSEGQRWLEGSAVEFSKRSNREELEGYSPMASDCAARPSPDWPHADGVVHVFAREENWHIVHCHQPAFSIQRSIPLWMCAMWPREIFGQQFTLESALVQLDQCRRAMRRDPSAVLGWIAGNRTEPVANAGAVDPSLEDLRHAVAIHQALRGAAAMPAPAPKPHAFWRGLQLLLEAWRSEYEGVWVAIRLEPSGVVRSRARGVPNCTFESFQSVEPSAPPFSLRGVSDETLMRELGARRIVLEGAVFSEGAVAGNFGDALVVPPRLLSFGELRDEGERSQWGRSKWDSQEERLSCANQLALEIGGADPDEQRRSRATAALAALLREDPQLATGDGSRVEEVLRVAMEVIRKKAPG